MPDLTIPSGREPRRAARAGALLALVGLVFAAAFGLGLVVVARALRPALGGAAELVLLLAPAGLAPTLSGLARWWRAAAPAPAPTRAPRAAPWPPGAPPASELGLLELAARGERLPTGCFVAHEAAFGGLHALLTPSGAWRVAGDEADGLPWADVTEVIVDGAGVRLVAREGATIAWAESALAIEPALLGAACRRWRDRAATAAA